MAIYHQFSRAQMGVAELVLQGMTNKEIADRLCVCEKTIKFHITAILRIVGADSRHRYIAKHYIELLNAIEKNKETAQIVKAIEKKQDDAVPELPR